ncbi:PX domain-containing protein [Algicola sagamiensis]|uniref:hypothetical protein n=1 Tax=Algicola sagamiensis TaxID=163869 RepID=UPI0003731F90|nr:hypothetical protein [Algicola sagamiensis]
MEQTQLKWRHASEIPSDELLIEYEHRSPRGIFLCYYPDKPPMGNIIQLIYEKEFGWNFDGFTHWAPIPELPDHHEPKKVLRRFLEYFGEENREGLARFLYRVRDRELFSISSVAAFIEREEHQAHAFITDVLLKENLIERGSKYNRDSFRLTSRGSLFQEISKEAGKDNG